MAEKKKKSKALLVLKWIIAIILVGCVGGIYVFVAPGYKTHVVFSGVEELTLPLSGVVVLDEELLKSDNRGFALMNYSDGTRVLAKTHIASLYSNDIDEAKVTKLKDLNEKINSLENSIKNRNEDENLTEGSSTALLKKMNKISYYGARGDFSAIQKEAIEFSNLVYGADIDAQQLRLNELKDEKFNIESSIDANEIAFFSKTAGVLHSKIDGYETVFTKEGMKEISPSDFETLMNSRPVDYKRSNSDFVFGRIINNYEISVFSICDRNDLLDLESGDILTIKSPDITNGSVSCTLISISEEEEGQVIIELRVSRNIDSFIKERKMQFDLVKKSYSGFRIPTEALRASETDDSTCVYAIKDGVVVEKPVEVLYNSGNFSIIKDDNTKSGNVLLYDIIISESRNLSAGTILNVGR